MSIKEILEEHGFRISFDNGRFLKMRPIYRESDNNTSLSVNKETGYWTDWATQQSGNINDLIGLTTGKITSNYTFERPTKPNNDDLKEFEIKFNKEEIESLLPSYSFYNKRGISNETLETFKAGLCTHGKMNSRFVFPIINKHGDLVGLAGRDMLKSDHRPKWKLMGKKASWAYPMFLSEKYIIEQKHVILVESIGDMLALYENNIKNCLVLFGLSVGNEILASLMQLPLNKIIISTNNDFEKSDNTGEVAAMKIKSQLSKWFDATKLLVSLPPDKDFGESSKDQIQSWHKNLGLN